MCGACGKRRLDHLRVDRGKPLQANGAQLCVDTSGADTELIWHMSANVTGCDLVKGDPVTLRSSTWSFALATDSCLA